MRKDVDCARVSWIGAGWYSGRCQHDQTNVNWVVALPCPAAASMGELTGPLCARICYVVVVLKRGILQEISI